MSTDTLTDYVTAEEYLERERAATNSKSEWIDGEIHEMVGSRRGHNVICANIVALLVARLRGKPLEVYPGDLKIRVPDGWYYYPDVAVAPDPPEFADDRDDIVLNPIVIVELLSPSTETLDRGRKLDDYRSLPSLRDYLLVDQFEARIDHYTRGDGGWTLTITRDLAATIALPSIGCELPLADVYDRILPAE